MTYLDEICSRPEPTLEIVREEMKLKSQSWIPHSDIAGSLDDAFQLWDAVSYPSGIDRIYEEVAYEIKRYTGG